MQSKSRNIWDNHKNNKLKKYLKWALVILWAIFIFYLSHQPAHQSDNLSKDITKVIVKIVENIAPNKDFNISNTNHMVRKNAHFFCYLVLGFLLNHALQNKKTNTVKYMLTALSICILYAISDEIHQLFIPGRGGQIKDIIIDTSGSIIGIIFHYILSKLYENKKESIF